MTVGEDIAFAPENDCVPQAEMKELVDRVAKLVDIDHHLEYSPQELSGGQKQRVSLAGVMVEEVKVLLFDEPLANLDPYDTRVLICMMFISVVVFKVSKIRIRDISIVLGLAAVFLIMNNLFVYLFSPEYGVGIYESRTVLFTIAGPYTITLQQLSYHFNMTMKVICVVPVALLFIACTDPSEFAASLASIGVSYRIGYSVSLALR